MKSETPLDDFPRNLGAEQLMALDRVMAIAEFELDGTLRHANANYLQLFGLSHDMARGRKHRSFCPQALLNSGRYSTIWSNLCAGNPFSGPVERIRDDGRSCWLDATYSPVFNAQGQVQHILKIATDITDRYVKEQAQQEHLTRLTLIADTSDAALIISDKDSRILHVNRGFTRLFGWQNEEALGKAPIGLLAPHLPPEFSENYHGALRAGTSVEREEIVVGKSGQRYWVKVISNPIQDAQGAWIYTVSMLTDITRSKMHEALQHRVLEALARERPLTEVLELVCQEVERIAPEVTASVLEVDAQGLLHPLAGASLPQSYSQLLDGQSIGPAAGSCGTAAWRNAPVIVDHIAQDPLWKEYRHLVLPLGYQACWSTPVRNSQHQPIGTFAFYFREPRAEASQDFHQKLIDACTHLCALALERESDRHRIRQLAFYDGLTGMPNRALLRAKADQAIASAARNHEQLAVLFIDLDRFKQVNDSLGHGAGDELLRTMAARLQQVLRANDIVGRLSGDEFAAVLTQCDADHATSTIERLQVLLAEPLTIKKTSLTISASIGISLFPADGQDLETLLQHADMAMYQAKSTGRGRFYFFSHEMNRVAQQKLMLEMELRSALQGRQLRLRLQYQPQIDLATGELYGVEALARWTHAEIGEIPPAQFIALAQEHGLTAELGRWALDEACRQLAQWRREGVGVPAVSVNLSPTDFQHLDLAQMTADTLHRHGLQPQDLTLELTESILQDANPATLKTLHDIHRQGVRLSMKDFGAGYSSLSYLRRLPVSELKLDPSFVADLQHDEAARSLSSAILGVGKSLHLSVVAEGVETDAQRNLLKDLGYPAAQGFLFAKPLHPSELPGWLACNLQSRAPAAGRVPTPGGCEFIGP